jgi:hypothetical protein
MSVALVTGASSGIGAAFVRRLTDLGYDLVLVGRNEKALGATSPSEVLVADLASASGARLVADRLSNRKRPIDLFVHAAGCTTSAPFGVGPLKDELVQIELNIGTTAVLLHAAWQAMMRRGGGSIIAIGSTAAIWSMGSYAASKAWLATVMADLARRSGESGVRCLLVTPGFTRTELHQRARVDASGVPRWMWLDPETVAAEGLRALDAGRSTCVPTLRYRVLVSTARVLPLPARAAAVRRLARLRSETRR